MLPFNTAVSISNSNGKERLPKMKQYVEKGLPGVPSIYIQSLKQGFMGKHLDFTSCGDETILTMLGRLWIRASPGAKAILLSSLPREDNKELVRKLTHAA
ncbi:hypothetical protein H671_2g8103 [Cricetulus griseus]|nr:hypothetical protein H671_2g8103 [Cricetulus griseus]